MQKSHTALWIRYLHNDRVWKCALAHKNVGKYSTEEKLFEEHMLTEHSNFAVSTLRSMAHNGGVPQLRRIDKCPICGDEHRPQKRMEDELEQNDSKSESDNEPAAKKTAKTTAKPIIRFGLTEEQTQQATDTVVEDLADHPSPDVTTHKRTERYIAKHLKALAFYFAGNLIVEKDDEKTNTAGARSMHSLESVDLKDLHDPPKQRPKAHPSNSITSGYTEAARIALEDASNQERALKRVKQALADKKLVIVTGAGVTLDATGYVPGGEFERLKWKGLIEHGFRYLERKCNPAISDQKKTLERNQKINNGRYFLSQSETETHLLAAQILRKELEDAGHFAVWLDSVFDDLPIKNKALLDALQAFHEKGATLLTTNYDHLLDRYCRLETIHRSATNDLLRFRRGRAFKDGVFHIHGSYQNPDDVILDPIDYYKVTVSPDVQDYLRKCLQDDLVLFVGCGDGLGDANFSALLRWITDKHRTIAHTHCLLVTNDDSYSFNPLVRLKYGANHSDLGPWLRTELLEKPPKTETVVTNPFDAMYPGTTRISRAAAESGKHPGIPGYIILTDCTSLS